LADIRYILNQTVQTAFNINPDFEHSLRYSVLFNIIIYEDEVEHKKTK